MSVDKAKVDAIASVFLDLLRLGYEQSAAEELIARAANRMCHLSQIMRGVALGHSLHQWQETAAAR